jgi:hypothetical protein
VEEEGGAFGLDQSVAKRLADLLGKRASDLVLSHHDAVRDSLQDRSALVRRHPLGSLERRHRRGRRAIELVGGRLERASEHLPRAGRVSDELLARRLPHAADKDGLDVSHGMSSWP